MTVDKQKVIAELRKYLDFPKTRGRLSEVKTYVEDTGDLRQCTCFCIEGVFCEVATKLSFEGRYVRAGAKTFFTRGGERFDYLPPGQVFNFLGIPRFVSSSEVKKAGFEEFLGKGCRGYSIYTTPNKKGLDYSWHTLNDHSTLSIKQLVELACNLLQKADHG